MADKYKTIDQGRYWEVHDWERGFCVATAIPNQAMADFLCVALNRHLEIMGKDIARGEVEVYV